MSNSSSLLHNRYMKQLVVNRLDAQTIRSQNINDGPDFIFSLICNNALIENNNNELILTLNKTNTNITKFSNRPVRISDNNYSFDTFSALFYLDKEFNSFESDPPNGVISDGINQQTFVFTHELHESFENNKIDSTLKLKLVTLNNEDVIIKTGVNNYNIFIDSLNVGDTYSTKNLESGQIGFFVLGPMRLQLMEVSGKLYNGTLRGYHYLQNEQFTVQIDLQTKTVYKENWIFKEMDI